MCKSLLNAYANISSGPRGLNFGQSLYLHPYFVRFSSKGSGESAHLCWLTWAFVAHQWDKYQNPMCWLEYFSESGSCPPGWLTSDNTWCYSVISRGTASWLDAQTLCTYSKANLASITSQDDYSLIYSKRAFLTLYVIKTPFNAFTNRADPHQATL